VADRSSGAFGELDKAAAELEKRLAGIRRNAESLVAEEEALTRRRTGVQQRIEEEVRRGRVRSETVAREGEAGVGRGRNVAEEARAQRAAAARTRAITTEQQALANLSRTRDSDLRSLQRLARQGPYPYSRNITELQLQQQRLAAIRAQAQTGVTPILTGAQGRGVFGGGGGGYGGGGGGGGFAGGPPFDPDEYRKGIRNVADLRAEEARLASTFNSANLVMRRHGALTTEFFQAAARGTVTIRDLGYQTVSTIGKFGGWLVAGSLLFGAAAGVGALARGALDASAGVNDLQRVMNNVDASRLRSQFSDLSEHFNVPIKDAADAVYQMGKVFKDQNQAVAAASTALYAVKIGEIDVATATRYLTSIVQGANLSAADMAVLFDQVNKAQNQFGASIDSTLAGLAKATGSYRNLGGNIQRYLLPLIVAAQRLTGQTGDVAGTAFQRIPNYLAQANNQATLRRYGINAQAPIDQILQQALNLSRTQQVDKQGLRDIAYAIFGHFYGPRIGVPLLQNPERVAQFQRQLQPEAARGSAERELQQLLNSIQERVHKIGIELQRMGDKLVESGLVDVIGVAVIGLGQLLEISNLLLDNWNDLPEPLRKGLAYALELGVAIRTAQRFQVGGALFGAGGGIRGGLGRALGNENTPIVQYRAAKSFMADEVTRLEQLGTTQTQALGLARTQAEVAKGEIAALERRIATLGTSEQAQARINVLQGELAVQQQIYTAQTEAAASALVGAQAAERQLATARAEQTALRRGGLPGFVAGQSRQAGEAVREGQRGLQSAAQETTVASAAVVRGAEETTRQGGRVRAAANSLRGTMARFGVGSLLGLLGDLAFAGFIGYELGQLAKGAIEDYYGAVQDAAPAPETYAEVKKGLPDLHQKVQDGISSTFADISHTIADGIRRAGPGAVLLQPLGGALDFLGDQMDERARELQSQAEQREAQFRQIAYQVQVFKGLRSGDYANIPSNPQEAEQRVRLQQLAPAVRAGLRAYGRFFEGLGHLGEGVRGLFGRGQEEGQAETNISDLFKRAREGDKDAARALDRLRRRRPGQFGAELGRQQAAILHELYSDSQGKVDIQGLTGAVSGVLGNFRQVAERLSTRKLQGRIAEIRGLLRNAGLKPEDAAALRQELEQIIQTAALASKGRGFASRLKLIKDPDTLQKLLEAQQSLQDIGRPEGTISRAVQVYQRIVQVLKGSHNPEDLKKLAEARKALADVLQHQVDLIGARGALRESRIDEGANPVGKQRAALDTLRRQLRFMQRHRNAFDIKDILQLQAQINDAEFQLQDAIRQQAEEIAHARFDVERARAGDNEVATARIDIQQALYDLRHARTPAERLQAQADLINARRQLRENIAARQIEDIEFQADIGKLTLEQQIAAYRRLLRTAELTRDQRRDLKRRIHQLREETDQDAGGFELDVGSIKLPTVYEIRRAIGGGYGGSQVNVTNAPNVYVNVADPNAASAVGQAIDNSLNTGTLAAMKNAGLA
jgi:TP901 family phage tail tape measure protein